MSKFTQQDNTLTFALDSVPATMTGDYLVIAAARPAAGLSRSLIIPAELASLLDAYIATQTSGYTRDANGQQVAVPAYTDVIDLIYKSALAVLKPLITAHPTPDIAAAIAAAAKVAADAQAAVEAAIAAEVGKLAQV